MATDGEKQNISRLDCSICLENFKTPKLLPCFHTFCVQCLEEYVLNTAKDGKFECPLCRAETCLPEGGVINFQSNFYIQSSESLNIDIDCQICEDGNKCTQYCLDCEEHLCGRCARGHVKMKMSRDHKLLSLDDSDADGRMKKVQSKMYCPQHSGEEVKMLCKDCDKLLCVVCKLTEHENHTSSGISKEAEQRRTLLSEKVTTAKKSLCQLGQNIVVIENATKEVEERHQYNLTGLEERVDDVVAKVKLEGDKLKKELRQKSEQALNYYSTEEKKLLQKIKEKETVLNHAENVIEIGDDFQVLDTTLLSKLSSFQISLEDDSHCIRNFPSAIFESSMETFESFTIGNVRTITFVEVKEIIDILYGTRFGILSNNANVMTLLNGELYVAFLDTYQFSNFMIKGKISERKIIKNCSYKGNISGLINAEADIYLCCLSEQSIYRLKGGAGNVINFKKLDNYPHGIAYSSCQNELLVCTLESKSNTAFEMGSKKGCVLAVSLIDKKTYTWKEAETPAATCIATTESGDWICLGYPAARKVVLHSKTGKTLGIYTGKDCEGRSELFCPVSVCFDMEQYVIVADYGNSSVIRIDKDGKYVQCVVKKEKPMSVVYGNDCTLYVGSERANIMKCVLEVGTGQWMIGDSTIHISP